MSAPAIDRATYEALKDTTGADFVRELANTFLQEAPKMLAELREALAVRDSERFRRAAHSLKSNSNTFGALTLATIARELELSSIAKVTENDGRQLDVLAEEYSRVAAALAGLRDA
ncbi:MAG TPA: Hpt domain-containing protein [Casimicrobiaceae bacterium]|jgi:HPt (histidine-containing phosphotransfer) domain-containing protein